MASGDKVKVEDFLKAYSIVDKDGKSQVATTILPDGDYKYTFRIRIQGIQQISDVLTENHVKLVFIGNSTSEQMNEYVNSMQEPLIGHLYSDPTLNFYNLFHFKRGIFRSLIMPLFSGVKKYGFRGIIEGARLGAEKSHLSGDSWQQGGTIILDKEANVLYKHQEEHPADWPDMREILPVVGISDKSVEYEKAVSDWLEVRKRDRQQKNS